MQESVKDQAVEVEVRDKEVSREQVAFYAFVRRRSVDYIEHVLNCIDYGTFDKVPELDGAPHHLFDRRPAFHFIKLSLFMAWSHVSLVPNSSDKEWLEMYHKAAEKNLEYAKAYHFTKPTVVVLAAVVDVLAPDGEHLCDAVKTLCLDAVQAKAKDEGLSDADSLVVREQESAWQESRLQLESLQRQLRAEPEDSTEILRSMGLLKSE